MILKQPRCKNSEYIVTYRHNQQLQKDAGPIHQSLILYTFPSHLDHTTEVIFEKGSRQSIYSLCMSGKAIRELNFTSKDCYSTVDNNESQWNTHQIVVQLTEQRYNILALRWKRIIEK